jgi:Family of unknown function (DUF6582)
LVGKKPARKPFGRDGPPKGYPKDQSLYADPENWRYPIHTSWHARAARRYFDDLANRSKYSKDEQDYIDWRINQALKKSNLGSGTSGSRKRLPPPTVNTERIDELSLEDLLRIFLGPARLKRAKEMDDSLVAITQENSDVIEGKVKEYVFKVDVPNRTILHDCQDWRNNMGSKSMCKHLGRLLMSLDEGKAAKILRQVLREKDRWSFISPNDSAH